MQTKLICAGAALLGIASYLAYLNYHYVLTGSMFIGGIAVTIFAITGKDKKDKQIEEIHATVTNKNKPLLLEPEKPEKPKKEQKTELSETHEKVLELLFDKESTVEVISKTLKLTKEEANYYLHDLYARVMVSRPTPYTSGPEQWRIGQGGREYVMTHRASEKTARDAWSAHT